MLMVNMMNNDISYQGINEKKCKKVKLEKKTHQDMESATVIISLNS